MSGYTKFVGAAMRRGMSMKQAAAAWKSRNAGKKVKVIKRSSRRRAAKRQSSKRGGSMAGRKRSYRSRARGFYRRHKKAAWAIPSVAGGIILLDAGNRLGWWQALGQLMSGGTNAVSQALGTVVANAKLGNIIVPAAAMVGVGIVRQAVGPGKVAKVGRFNIRMF